MYLLQLPPFPHHMYIYHSVHSIPDATLTKALPTGQNPTHLFSGPTKGGLHSMLKDSYLYVYIRGQHKNHDL